MPAAVCKFWLQGYCRNGDSCRFDHPSNRNQSNNRGPNRFAPLENDRPGQGGRGSGPRRDAAASYSLDVETIRTDLSKEPPQWILSSYGPGRNAPAQLFGGLPREQSFEEMRLRHYELAAQGQAQQAIDEAQKLNGVAAEQMRVALQDVNGAIEFICSAENNHPNRIDICKSGTVGNSTANSGFSNTQGSQGFGKPSGASFGQPQQAPSSGRVFGKPSVPSGGGFGQPSGPPAGGFGQPSAISTGAFGQPSAPSTGGFDQPSTTSTVRFGQPSAPNAGGFGQPSAPATGAFSQPSAPSTGGFGQPSVASTGGFGNPSKPSEGDFGRPSSGGFGQPGALTGGAFGQPSSSPFGKPAQQASNPFAKAQGAFGTNSQPAQFATGGQAPLKRDNAGRISSWKGKPVAYPDESGQPCFRRTDGQWERIWFPEGEPARTMAQEIPLEHYDGNLEQEYQYLNQNGEFKAGIIPQFPPKWEWTSWDF